MCGKKSKSGLLLLVLLFLLSSASLWAERVLTDEAYNELLTLLETQETQLTEQEITIEKLETELSESQTELTRVKSWSKTQDETIAMLSQLIDVLKKSLETLRSGDLPIAIEFGGVYVPGVNYPGLYAGISITF